MASSHYPVTICCKKRERRSRNKHAVIGLRGPRGLPGRPGIEELSYLAACTNGPLVVGFVPLTVTFQTDDLNDYIVTQDWLPAPESGEQTTFSSKFDGVFAYWLRGIGAGGAGTGEQEITISMSLLLDDVAVPCGTHVQESEGGADQFFMVLGMFRYRGGQQISVQFDQELGGSMVYHDVSLVLIRQDTGEALSCGGTKKIGT